MSKLIVSRQRMGADPVPSQIRAGLPTALGVPEVPPRNRRSRFLRQTWLWVAMPIIALLPGTIAVLPMLFPRDQSVAEPASVEAPATGPPAQYASPNRVGLPQEPATGTTGLVTRELLATADPALAGDLSAFADALRQRLPLETRTPTLAPRHTLTSVEVFGADIVFHYEADIDLTAIVLTWDPEPLLPHVVGWNCDPTCIGVTEGFFEWACGTAVAPLVARGAGASYVYQDRNGLLMAWVTVTAADCALFNRAA